MEKQIEESNKLIAKFMGVNDTIPHDHQGIYPYNSSWDWLMPVVAKINTLDYLDLWTCNNVDEHNLITALSSVDINSTYELCIEFIKWYNLYQKGIKKPTISFEAFKEDLMYYIIPNRNVLRVGQAIMVYLSKVHINLYNRVLEQNDNDIDCFYVDYRIPTTLNYLKENWNG